MSIQSSQPLEGEIVTVRIKGENYVVKFAQTKQEGSFEFELSNFPDRAAIYFSMMSFESKDFPLVKSQQKFNVWLDDRATQLNEVIIKAPKIRQ